MVPHEGQREFPTTVSARCAHLHSPSQPGADWQTLRCESSLHTSPCSQILNHFPGWHQRTLAPVLGDMGLFGLCWNFQM